MTVAVNTAAPRQPRDSRLPGIILAVTALVAAIALLAANPHLLVQLSSDRDGDALLPVSTLAPGSSTTGGLTLANEGLLPLRYDLTVRAGTAERESGVILRVRRNGAANYLYQGPIPDRPLPIGVLAPGQRDSLEVTVFAPRSEATASVPVDETFVWTARSPGIESWLWLLAVAAVLVAIAFAAPRLFALWAERVRRVRVPFELYWRAPLILAVICIAMLVPLSSVALASVNSQSANPGNVFAIGSLVLSDAVPSRTSCISVTGPTSQAPAGDCDAIFQFSQGAPGQVGTAKVTIRNVGTVPIRDFRVWSSGCTTHAAPTERAHGTADVCAWVAMAVHDDNHDRCYYPVQAVGACPAGGSMGDFGRTYSSDAGGLRLDPQGLGAGITFTFTVQVNPAAPNSAQGLQPLMDFHWLVSQ